MAVWETESSSSVGRVGVGGPVSRAPWIGLDEMCEVRNMGGARK